MEIIGMGWSVFALVLLAFVAIGSFFIKNGKNDAGLNEETRKEVGS